jgi:hypothetical protein
LRESTSAPSRQAGAGERHRSRSHRLQLPVAGHPLHTRSLTLVVTVRDDGRWNARGDVIDLRKCSFVPLIADIQPAGIVHMMSIDTVVDPKTRTLDALQVDQPFVAVEASEATRGECCRDPVDRLQAMVGERFDEAFAKRLRGVFGGPLGCSHLLTLFQLMASALPRALDLEDNMLADGAPGRVPEERPFRRSVFLDGHEGDDGAIDLGVQLADFHTRPSASVEMPLERLALESDARVIARIAMPDHRIHEIAGSVRDRTGTDLLAGWIDRSAWLTPLVGTPIMAGMARPLFAIAREHGMEPWLLDAALQLAPGHIQVMAAVAERWFTNSGGLGEAAGSDPRGSAPAAPVGGMLDSCYIWRDGGPLAAGRKDFMGRRGSEE